MREKRELRGGGNKRGEKEGVRREKPSSPNPHLNTPLSCFTHSNSSNRMALLLQQGFQRKKRLKVNPTAFLSASLSNTSALFFYPPKNEAY